MAVTKNFIHRVMGEVEEVMKWVDGWKIDKKTRSGFHIVCPDGYRIALHETNSDVNSEKITRRMLAAHGFTQAKKAAKLKAEDSRKKAIADDAARNELRYEHKHAAARSKAAGIEQPSIADILTPWPIPKCWVMVSVDKPMADKILEHNTRNRPGSSGEIRDKEAALKADDWEYTHQGIALSNETPPVLLDGQTRLQAISNTGIPMDLQVTIGLKPKAYDYMDQARRRNAGHSFAADGERNPGQLQALVRLVHLYDTGDPRIWGGHTGRRLTIHKTHELFKENPDAYRWAVDNGKTLARLAGGPHGAYSGALYLLRRAVGPDDERFQSFITKIGSGEMMRASDAPMRVRDWVLDSLKHGGRVRTEVLLGIIILAWEAYAQHKTIPKPLSLMPTDAFPRLYVPGQ